MKRFVSKGEAGRERRTHRVKLSLEYDERYKADDNEYRTEAQIS